MPHTADPGQTSETATVELINAADLLPLALARQRLAVRSADGTGFDLIDPARPQLSYELDTEWLRDARSVLDMIRHLGAKRWVTGQHLADLAAAALQSLDQPTPPAPRMRVIGGGRTT